MKFISKSNNLRIVLKPGISAERLTGRAAVNGIYVKFEDGVVNIEDQGLIDMMLAHPGYRSDYIAADKDPYASNRKNLEPIHDTTEIEASGAIGKTIKGKEKIVFTSQQKEVLKEMAMGIAKEMAPELAKGMIKDVLAKKEQEKNSSIEEDKTKEVKEVLEEEERPETSLEKARRVKAEKAKARKDK